MRSQYHVGFVPNMKSMLKSKAKVLAREGQKKANAKARKLAKVAKSGASAKSVAQIRC